jgi:dTDP-4-dehydrorhamnose reductase
MCIQRVLRGFSNPEGIAETVRAIKPDVIVNAAAHTAVDKAESEPDFARLLNATSVEAIAKEAAKIDAWVVHYSTDYVFLVTVKRHGVKRIRLLR